MELYKQLNPTAVCKYILISVTRHTMQAILLCRQHNYTLKYNRQIRDQHESTSRNN